MNMNIFSVLFDFWMIGLPIPVGLAAIALVGYLFGSRSRRDLELMRNQSRGDLKRAKMVISQLEDVTSEVRQSLARHHASILHFKDRVSDLNDIDDAESGEELCLEAEKMIGPTLDLASHISHAYDELRQQTSELMLFTDVRVDPLTGLRNRKALDESLKGLLALMARYDNKFSVAVIEIDHFQEISENKKDEDERRGDQVLQQVGQCIDRCVRETDILARCEGGEFVIVMPETELEGARVFGRRLREAVEQETSVTISGGVTMVLDGDSIRTLMARADTGLYSAKAAGFNCIYFHDGELIEQLSIESENPTGNEFERELENDLQNELSATVTIDDAS